MAKPYSEDLRSRAVETILDGATIPETAEYHGVSISSIVRFLKLHRETGSVSPAKFGGYKDFALAEHEELVRQLVADRLTSHWKSLWPVWRRKRSQSASRRFPVFFII